MHSITNVRPIASVLTCYAIPMKVMGVKVSTNEVRFAVVSDESGSDFQFLNPDDSKIAFPKSDKTRFDRAEYLFGEFKQLVSKYSPDSVTIKLFEPNSPSFRMYATSIATFETAVALAAKAEHVAVTERYYASLKLSSKTAEDFVLKNILKQGVGWNSHLVDSLAVALKEFGR